MGWNAGHRGMLKGDEILKKYFRVSPGDFQKSVNPPPTLNKDGPIGSITYV